MSQKKLKLHQNKNKKGAGRPKQFHVASINNSENFPTVPVSNSPIIVKNCCSLELFLLLSSNNLLKKPDFKQADCYAKGKYWWFFGNWTLHDKWLKKNCSFEVMQVIFGETKIFGTIMFTNVVRHNDVKRMFDNLVVVGNLNDVFAMEDLFNDFEKKKVFFIYGLKIKNFFEKKVKYFDLILDEELIKMIYY